MGRPRKSVAAAPAPVTQDEVQVPPAVFFDDEESAEEQVDAAPVAPAPAAPSIDFSRELQMLREVMEAQRQQIAMLTQCLATERQSKSEPEPSISQQVQLPAAPVFRKLPPSLPNQRSTEIPATNHARLGLTADFPTQTKSQQTHMAELRLGSRYIVRGSNGLA